MVIPGYCVECHKFKQVEVNSHGMMRAAVNGGVPEGVCLTCKEDDDQLVRSIADHPAAGRHRYPSSV